MPYLPKAAEKYAKTTLEGLLYCKTNIAGYFFDGFITVSHDLELEITSNQVDSGASIVDHAYRKPATLQMRVTVSDAHRSLVAGQFSQNYARHVSAWNVLKKIQADRIPVSVFTKLGLYDNMLIQSLRATDDSDTISTLVADVTLKEVPVATLRTVKISNEPQTSENSNIGKVNVRYLDPDDVDILDQYLTGMVVN